MHQWLLKLQVGQSTGFLNLRRNVIYENKAWVSPLDFFSKLQGTCLGIYLVTDKISDIGSWTVN